MSEYKYVYYPCAGTDGSAVKIFSKLCTDFIYVDIAYNSEDIDIESELENYGFCGYKVDNFGPGNIHEILREFKEFVTSASLVRLPEFNDTHGPERLAISFLKGDGIEMLDKIVQATKSPPFALMYIRPGLGFGTNRSTYPQEINKWILEHQAIEYIAYDKVIKHNPDAWLPILDNLFTQHVLHTQCNTQMANNVGINVVEKSTIA